MKCKICGTRLKDGTTQCPTCGAVVGNEEATANIANLGAMKRTTCPTCGKEVIGEHRRCPFCKDYLMRNDFGDAAKQAASTQSQQVKRKLDDNKVSCAYCGCEVDKNNIPAGWGTKHPVYVCKNCMEKGYKQRHEYSINEYIDYCRSNGFAVGSVTELAIPQGFVSVTIAGGNIDKNFECLDPITKLVLPEGLRIIHAARYLPNLTEVYIPHSCELIGGGAFRNCEKLKSVVIPEKVTHIGHNAFYKCTSLKTVTIPESVVEIGEMAFSECSSLSTIIMESSIPPVLYAKAFDNNAPGRKVIVPKGSLVAYKNAPGWKNVSNLCEG